MTTEKIPGWIKRLLLPKLSDEEITALKIKITDIEKKIAVA
jgi:hypothetical protein